MRIRAALALLTITSLLFLPVCSDDSTTGPEEKETPKGGVTFT